MRGLTEVGAVGIFTRRRDSADQASAGLSLEQQAALPPRFEAVGEETRVSVEHRGFDQVPAGSAARHRFPDQVLLMRLAEYWQAQLASLRDRQA